MSDAAPTPLRPLERHLPPGGGGRIALRDPLGIAPEATGRALVLERPAWEIARRFDGRRTASELAEEVAEVLGRAVDAGQVRELEARLGAALLLDDAEFETHLSAAFDAFRRDPRRAAHGPGRDYELDPFDLRARIGGLVADDWDMPPLESAQGLWAPAGGLGAAGPLHSRAWAAVRHLKGRIARVVLIANAGAPFNAPLIPLAKPYELPLGLVHPDSEALAALNALPGRLQLAHARHLGTERALLFVRLLFPGVPALVLLASSLDARGGLADLDRAAEGLARVLALEGRTLLVCAADLVRVGSGGAPGAPETTTPRGAAPVLGGALGAGLRAHDDRALDLSVNLDHAAFRDHALATEDPARAAAAAAPYHVLRALHGRPALAAETTGSEVVLGSTLGYLQMSSGGEVSSGAAVVFH